MKSQLECYLSGGVIIYDWWLLPHDGVAGQTFACSKP